jgi:cysteine synthase
LLAAKHILFTAQFHTFNNAISAGGHVMIDFTMHPDILAKNIQKARQNNVLIPTFSEMIHPETIPEKITRRLENTGLWDLDPVNLFRITWKNQPQAFGGLFGGPNVLELPSSLTGVNARIVCLVGKWFPTGCHKVGASFGCLVPRLVTGQFDASRHKAVWPSTGNYCRGGAFNSKLLACDSIAILPAEMSRERFEWLSSIAGEVIATPGCESNVKEIFDKTNELRATRDDVYIFNQFEEMGNHLWHYEVTGRAIEEAYKTIKKEGDRLAGACFTSGSAGTIGSGDYLKEQHPKMKLAVGEALQCPTLLNNGYGAHRIEGIGDKHVPWIHNVKNTDMVIDIDDDDTIALLRLFNDPVGKNFLIEEVGIARETVESLHLLGISGIANVLCAVKMAKYYEMTQQDIIFTVLTDSVEMYMSRLSELEQAQGIYTPTKAAVDYNSHLLGMKTDNMEELTTPAKRRIHNLKYYTWVEQQGRTSEELDALWFDEENTWGKVHRQTARLDELIRSFNEETGILQTI